MPNIRLITGKPGPSGPTLTAEGFGAPAARGLQTLGQGLGEAASQLNQSAQAEKRIKDAKEEQLLRERIAQAQVALDEARFQAEEEVPSDADRPGQKFTQIVAGKTPKTLQTRFEEIADSKLSDLRADLQGESLERFEAATGIFRDQSVLRIRGVQRARDIDSGRAAFVRTEETLMSLASDPNTDLSSVLSQHAGAADSAVDTGLYKKESMALVKKTFREGAKKVHEQAQFLIQVQAATDELMDLPISASQKLKIARQEFSGEMEKEVVAAIEHRSAQEARFETEALAGRFDIAAEQLEFDGATPTEVGVDTFPAAESRALKAVHKAAVEDGQLETVTLPSLWERLWDMRANDPEAFSNLNLSQHRPDLANDDYKELRTEWNGLRAGQKRSEVKVGPISTGAFSAKPLIAKVEKNEDVAADLLFRLNEIIVEKGKARGKELDLEEQRREALELLRPSGEFSLTGNPFRRTPFQVPITLLELTPTKAREIAKRKIVDQEPEMIELAREQLIATAADNGIELTPEKITGPMIQDQIADFLESNGFFEQSALEILKAR